MLVLLALLLLLSDSFALRVGAIIDERALIEALNAGTLAGALPRRCGRPPLAGHQVGCREAFHVLPNQTTAISHVTSTRGQIAAAATRQAVAPPWRGGLGLG